MRKRAACFTHCRGIASLTAVKHKTPKVLYQWSRSGRSDFEFFLKLLIYMLFTIENNAAEMRRKNSVLMRVRMIREAAHETTKAVKQLRVGNGGAFENQWIHVFKVKSLVNMLQRKNDARVKCVIVWVECDVGEAVVNRAGPPNTVNGHDVYENQAALALAPAYTNILHFVPCL